MEVEELYSKSQEKYHGNCNCKKFCTTFDDKYNYHHLYASQDLHFRVNHVPRMPRRPKTITIFKNGKFRKYAYFKGFSTLIKKYILSNEISNSSLANYRKAKSKYHLSSRSKSNEEIISKKLHPFRVNLIVNTVTGTEHFYYSANTFGKPCWKIYRCQFNTQEESCCCSCNSDAMFEVMKSLYDCYKKKNCDHCNCILCGHLPKEERRLGEIRKSVPELKAISAVKSKKIKKMKGKTIKDVTSLLKDKSPEEKENILRDLVNAGAILPKGKTKSEKELIQKVEAERKERIKSEALISKKRIPSAKLRKVKEEGLLTPLEGKTPKQKEKILKGLAMNGIPLPTAKTPSTKKIIDKVRKEMGLPPEPLTAEDKQKYKNAMEMGLITPLEGKSPIEKKRILQELAATGVPLPEARTSSEKALIAKVKEQIPTEIAIKPEKRKPISRSLMEVKTLSDKLRKAKAEGLLTPLEGKTDEQKRKILKELVKNHIPLPEGKTASEKKLIDQVHEEMGLPPQPKTPSTKEKYQEAIKAGLVTPLEGKTASEKEKVLTDLATLGVELPVGRTSSEKALIAKIKENVPVLGEIPVRPERKLTKPGVLPSLRGKTSEEKEQLLKNFAINNIPLPEGKSPSEKVLIDKIRADIGLPPEPKSKSEKGIYKQAQAVGLIVPLEGKTQSEKEKILQGQADLGLELPQGRTASEKSLINKIKKGKKKKVKTRDKGISPPALPLEKRKKLDTKTLKVMKESKGPSDECICGLLTPESERFAPESLPSIKIPSEKLKAAKAAGFLTPLEGKTPSQKEKILKNLAKAGIPLPEPKTASEKKILQKVQNDLGLPPTPLTPSLKEKYAKAQVAGIITPLEGKTPSQKEKILNKQAEMGLNLPVGRTPSEQALIDKIRTGVRTAEIPFEKIRKYSLEGRTPEEKEKILKNLAKTGLPLPEGKTPSEKAIVKKVKEAAGLPIVSPPASERLRKAKAAGLLTPLEGKTPAQKEDLIKRHLAAGIPLPEPKTASEKKIIKDVLAKSSKLLHGKTLSQKEKFLKNIAKQGLPLPEPKTASDKAVVDKIRAEATPLKLKQAQAAGLMTPLQGKTNEEKEKILKGLVKAGIPLPEATSPSEKKVFEKVRYDLGLPPEPISLSMKEKMHQAQVAGIITPLEGKTPAQKEKVLKKMHEAGIPLPKGKTKSEKSMIKKIKDEVVSEKLKEAKVKGLITPMEGKTPEQKEKILRKLAKSDMPLPEGKTPSEKALIAKIKAEEGIVPKLRPPELPEKIKKLDKKTAKIMKEGKGPSDKCICGLLTPKPVSEIVPVQKIPSEKMRKAKAAGLLTPLEGKSPEQKEKILKGLAMHEIPLPEPKTASEKRLHDKVRADLGMTPEPKTPSAKLKYNDAVAAGLIAPLEGKSPSQKEKILKGQAALGLSLPEGRTPSEKALIAKIKAGAPKPEEKRIPVHIIPSEKLRKAKEAGILTPLEGKTPEQKEKNLKELALRGIPLPEPKTASESKVIDKVVAALGMPPQPKTSSEKLKYKQAAAAGLITPLQGKSKPQKEKNLRGQAQLGLPLPEGRTTSEKVLIAKIKAKPKSLEKISRPALPHQKLAKLDKKTAKVMKESKKPSDECICELLTPETERGLKEAASIIKIPSKKLLKAKTAGLLTPLKGKTAKQKEKILKDLAMQGIPLPEATTSSEKKIFAKVRNDIGLPPEPKTSSMKQKYNKAIADNIIVPLEGKTNVEKEQVLRKQVALGLPLPVGRTPSEKALIAKVEKEAVPSEKLRKAKAAGLLTPLEGKTPQQKEKILQGLAEAGLPLPEAKTTSEIALIQKIKPKPEVAPKYIATEKEKVKTKSRKVGVPKSKGGIIEEFQDIVKTTTCDKGCGCDKKKIRFKHSYVKIRVTSPDISSLCPCPEECLPGVKGGVFTDNEGIKVTVGRVTCIPSNHSRKLNGNDNYEENYKYCSTLTQSTMFKNCTNKKMFDSKSESDISLSRRSFLYNSDYYLKKNIAFVDSYLCSISACGISSASVQNVLSTDISVNSFESINFLKTTSSVSLTTLPSSVSVWSFSATSHSTSNCSDEESSLMKNYIDNYENIRNILLPRQNKGNISYTSLNTNEYKFATQKEIQIYRASDVNNNVFDNQLNSAHSGSTHIIYVEEIDNKNEIAKLLKKTISETSNLYNSSSLFVIVSSSSDNSSEYCSSTICLDLSETHSIWNPGTSGLHHLRERQKGFKISTRGNGRDLGNNDNLLSPPPRAIAETLVVPKKYDNLLHRNNCKRKASTDTTEDRPCCCEVNNMNNDHRDVRVQRSERIVSEFLKPMILKDVVNQGFSHDYYMLDLPDTSKSSYSSPHHSNRCEPTPVRLCKLAPCSGHNICHDNEQMKKRHYVHPNVSPPTLQFYKSCDCSTDKLKKVFEENAKQLVSIACGDSNVDLRKGCNKMERRRVQMPYEITSEPNKCSSCTSSKSNFQPILARDNKKYSCPCEEHQKMSYMDIYSREFDSTTSNKQNNCQCPDRPQKKKNKNVVCECPEEPELEFDISDWFDEKQLRKMQSDLTQTTSGFKIQIPRKKSDSEVSFEEALRYYAENFENIDDEKCGCKDKSKKKSNARCECQYELPPPVEHAVPINEPFPGIKFRIDGKGTASKGLSGILCFE